MNIHYIFLDNTTRANVPQWLEHNYHRKTDRASYGQATLRLTLDALKTGDLTKRGASIQYGIPRATVIKILRNPEYEPTSLGRHKRVFDDAFEAELCTHSIEMLNRFYGLSLEDLRSLPPTSSASFDRSTMQFGKTVTPRHTAVSNKSQVQYLVVLRQIRLLL